MTIKDKPQVLVASEKHGLRIFDARNQEALHASALQLLRERIRKEWYREPKPSDGSHSENRRYKKEHAVWADIVVADANSDGMRAWRALQDRSDYEYEQVLLYPLESSSL